jgi:ferrous iron transport protein B
LPLLVRLLREVFVGTLATIYSVGGSDNEVTIKNKMAAEINRN